MKITHYEVTPLTAKLITPFKTALRATSATDGICVRLFGDNGKYGVGEAAATAAITGETSASITFSLTNIILPSIIGMDLFDKTAVLVKIKSCIQRNTSAKAACEIAYFDLYTKTMGIPLYKYFGASKPVSLKTDITISLDTPEKMVSDSVTAIGRGFDILKLKLGGDPRSDLYRLEAVREAVGKKIILRIDANQGWSPKEAIFIINEAERRNLGVELVEQPVKAADIEGLETVSKGVLTPVLADEAVFGISDAIEVIKRGAADMINIKLMKTGGLNTAASVISICREYGVRCMMGCMLENPVGVIAAAHLAAANADVVTKIDLDPPFLISENPVSSSVKFEKGNIILSDAPGLGVEINYDRK